MTRLILLTRPGCHLCDAMKMLVEGLSQEHPLTIEEIDITGRAELESLYGQEIPVLMLGDDVVAKVRTTPQALLERIKSTDP